MRNRIVIADDDPTMRSALGEAMRSAGYEAELFCNGAEAEQHLRRCGADLVISDMRMPELGGLELLKQCSHIPFIMISGFATVPEAVDAMKIGAYDFVVKPFSYRELIPLVEAARLRRTSPAGQPPVPRRGRRGSCRPRAPRSRQARRWSP